VESSTSELDHTALVTAHAHIETISITLMESLKTAKSLQSIPAKEIWCWLEAFQEALISALRFLVLLCRVGISPHGFGQL
jgi:hypothetical protein